MPTPYGDITTTQTWLTPAEETNESNQEAQDQEEDSSGAESIQPSQES